MAALAVDTHWYPLTPEHGFPRMLFSYLNELPAQLTESAAKKHLLLCTVKTRTALPARENLYSVVRNLCYHVLTIKAIKLINVPAAPKTAIMTEIKSFFIARHL